ncbi:hypothetical protein HL653_13175 [Sphingomonas sp. AP4-R1]|uniref:hypothetical protein n=1 Tax=Sphingomonas sp. AP4-R1 TaxID=2735134 RepID=UPI001493D929|nr:hypothetical protein [Sphingomonas sp. AP4-R1]QJU58586.1 hypothetical protein HL653_13175 [Sphingomonas sp. AP4-R1]
MNEASEEKKEAARVRRRWLNLGELLAIAGVVISGAALWNSYRERTHAEAEQANAEARTTKAAETLVLRATVEKDGNLLSLAPRDPDQTIQAQTIRFPAALGLSPIETSGDARIERVWFERGLTDALEKAKATKRAPGDQRLPVQITTRFLVGGIEHEDSAIYSVAYTLGHGFLAGTTVKMRGISRVGVAAPGSAGDAALEAAAKKVLG